MNQKNFIDNRRNIEEHIFISQYLDLYEQQRGRDFADAFAEFQKSGYSYELSFAAALHAARHAQDAQKGNT